MSDVYTPTYILTWNPNVFEWEGYDKLYEIVKECPVCINWSCRSNAPEVGDRSIFLMQGMGDRNGIFAVGEFASSPYDGPGTKFGSRYVDVDVLKMWDYKADFGLPFKTKHLKEHFPDQCWTPQGSGIKVKSYILPKLWAYMGMK